MITGMDAEAAAAAVATKDAQDNRKNARARRSDAQQQKISRMHDAAHKLREMANNALYKGILKATPAICDVVCKAADQIGDAAASAGDGGGAVIKATAGAVSDVVGKLGQAAQVADQIDPFGISNAYKQTEKAEIDASAEASGHSAQKASDDLSEAQRLQGSMTSLMEKMLESRHAAMMAAVK